MTTEPRAGPTDQNDHHHNRMWGAGGALAARRPVAHKFEINCLHEKYPIYKSKQIDRMIDRLSIDSYISPSSFFPTADAQSGFRVKRGRFLLARHAHAHAAPSVVSHVGWSRTVRVAPTAPSRPKRRRPSSSSRSACPGRERRGPADDLVRRATWISLVGDLPCSS